MKNLTNYHSHCSFCDGHAPLEAFVQEAVRQGFTSYGISSHAPLPFSTRWTMEASDMDAYLAEIDRLREKYAGQIELYTGLEIDYLDERSNPAAEYFRSLPLDYRIGSVHMLHDAEGRVVDTDTSPEVFAENLRERLGGDLRRVLERYYDTLTRMIELGGFDILGHADKLSFNASRLQPGITDEPWYRRRMEAYFELIARSGLMVEVNTKAFELHGRFFPHREHFVRLRELGIPVLVNSDAHRPERINSGRREALEALKEAGIDTVMELHGGAWQALPIEL